ncbi:Uncharacterised protein [Mycobacteroides abscessus]|nr:Uncharacterised protein [Mycobacteroides abscessus]
MQGLVVELAFSGDHQVGPFDRLLETGMFGHDSCPRFAAAAEGEKCRPDATGGTGAGEVPDAAAGAGL